jgi:hypothetical protein
MPVTARQALDAVSESASGERLRRYETTCAPRGGCGREKLEGDPGRWTWCPDCLTVYDDYGESRQSDSRTCENALRWNDSGY